MQLLYCQKMKRVAQDEVLLINSETTLLPFTQYAMFNVLKGSQHSLIFCAISRPADSVLVEEQRKQVHIYSKTISFQCSYFSRQSYIESWKDCKTPWNQTTVISAVGANLMHFSDIFFMLWKRNMTNLAFKIAYKNGGFEITHSVKL